MNEAAFLNVVDVLRNLHAAVREKYATDPLYVEVKGFTPRRLQKHYRSVSTLFWEATIHSGDLTLRHPVDETPIRRQVDTLAALLQSVQPSRFYRAERERSIVNVAAALLNDREIIQAVRHWKTLSPAERFQILGRAAFIQSQHQHIGGLKALPPNVVEAQDAKVTHPKTGESRVILGRQGRVTMDSDAMGGEEIVENRIHLNMHPDAANDFENPQRAFSIAAHEQQHDMQETLRGTAFQPDLVCSGLRKDALKFHFSLAANLSAMIYTPYRAQLHEKDAWHVGDGIAARLCAALS